MEGVVKRREKTIVRLPTLEGPIAGGLLVETPVALAKKEGNAVLMMNDLTTISA